MPYFDNSFVKDHIQFALLLGIVAYFLSVFAKKAGFFKIPAVEERKIPIRFTQVLSLFAIYLFVSLFLIPFIASKLLFASSKEFSLLMVAKLQLFALVINLIALGSYLFAQNRSLIRRIWKDSDAKKSTYAQDIGSALVLWLIAFPLVAFISQIGDLLLYILFGVEHYEQVAVRFLKMALHEPKLLSVALLTILVGAPLIEETLFRGFLQTWLKNKLGRKAAISVASLAFAFFHIAPSQGLGNLSLLPSLFVFGIYLGFIYEKRRSLLSCMVLHATFNLVSALRILTLLE